MGNLQSKIKFTPEMVAELLKASRKIKVIPPELAIKREKAKKVKRRESNKSRKVNQARNRKNKFTR